MESKSEPLKMLRPGRKINGISATLLPFRQNGKVDWNGFCGHVDRTARAGLVPAVNMDTGHVNLIEEQTRTDVLMHTRQTLGPKIFSCRRVHRR